VFGGTLGGTELEGGNRNDVWAFDTTKLTWREMKTGGESPLPRRGHQAVMLDGVMWVFGGDMEHATSNQALRHHSGTNPNMEPEAIQIS